VADHAGVTQRQKRANGEPHRKDLLCVFPRFPAKHGPLQSLQFMQLAWAHAGLRLWWPSQDLRLVVHYRWMEWAWRSFWFQVSRVGRKARTQRRP